MKKLLHILPLLILTIFATSLLAQPEHVKEMKRYKEEINKQREYDREMRKADEEYFREVRKADMEYERERRKAEAEYYREMEKADREAYKEYWKARREAMKEGRPLPPRPHRHRGEYEYDDYDYDDDYREGRHRRPESRRNGDVSIEGQVVIRGRKQFPLFTNTMDRHQIK